MLKMNFVPKNIFNRKSTEDKSEPAVVTKSASGNNGDTGAASPNMHGDNRFQMTGESRKRSWLGYIKTREFWMALVLGYAFFSSTFWFGRLLIYLFQASACTVHHSN